MKSITLSKKAGIVLVIGIIVIAGTAVIAALSRGRMVERAELALERSREMNNEQIASLGAPDLNRPIIVRKKLSADVETKSLAQIAEIITELKKDPSYNYWIELATHLKIIGDYEGAEEILQYAIIAWPAEVVPYANLMNLYIYDQKDFVKGEAALLETIERAPNQILYYEIAYEFYHFIVKNDAKGKEVITKGLRANPRERAALESILARF